MDVLSFVGVTSRTGLNLTGYVPSKLAQSSGNGQFSLRLIEVSMNDYLTDRTTAGDLAVPTYPCQMPRRGALIVQVTSAPSCGPIWHPRDGGAHSGRHRRSSAQSRSCCRGFMISARVHHKSYDGLPM